VLSFFLSFRDSRSSLWEEFGPRRPFSPCPFFPVAGTAAAFPLSSARGKRQSSLLEPRSPPLSPSKEACSGTSSSETVWGAPLPLSSGETGAPKTVHRSSESTKAPPFFLVSEPHGPFFLAAGLRRLAPPSTTRSLFSFFLLAPECEIASFAPGAETTRPACLPETDPVSSSQQTVFRQDLVECIDTPFSSFTVRFPFSPRRCKLVLIRIFFLFFSRGGFFFLLQGPFRGKRTRAPQREEPTIFSFSPPFSQREALSQERCRLFLATSYPPFSPLFLCC